MSREKNEEQIKKREKHLVLPLAIFILVFFFILILVILYLMGNLGFSSPPLYPPYITFPPAGTENVALAAIILLSLYIVALNILFLSHLKGWKKIAANLGVIIIFFGILEWSLQNYIQRHPTQYLPDPDLIWKLNPGEGSNQAGFRDREMPGEKKPGELRLVILGDSSAYGLGVPEPSRFGNVLERELQKKYMEGEVRVINLAVPGYTIFQAKELAKRIAYGLKPDYVIISLNNDANIDAAPDRSRVPPKGLAPVFNLLYKSRVYLLLRKLITNRRIRQAYSGSPDARWVRRVSDGEIEQFYGEVIDDTLKMGGKVIIIGMPIRSEELSKENNPHTVNRELLKKIAQDRKVIYLNVFDQWKDKEESESWFLEGDILHPNNEGHRKIGEALLKVINTP